VEILYGTPDDHAAHDLWIRGKVMLRPWPESRVRCISPGWACRECGYESQPIELTPV